ncbi:MAG: DegV family protein [Anaerolineae bacterium]|nr:DegV family protein [Anaerolineae bacterium]
MTRVAMVTDSGANLPVEAQHQYGIHIVPLKVIFEDQTLRDGVDVEPSRFYELLEAASELPTTSQPSTGDFFEVYSGLSEEADAIVSIHTF